MNKFVFCFVILGALAFINAKPEGEKKHHDDDDEDNRPVSEKFRELANKVHDKFNTSILLDIADQSDKMKERCPEIKEKMEKAGEEVYKCFEEKESDDQTMCSLLINNWSKCLKPARDVLSTCVPEESREVLTLADKVIVALLDQTCHSTVEEVVELLNPCALDVNPETYPACKELKTMLSEHNMHQLPTTATVCETLPKMRNCAAAMVDGSCKGKVSKSTWKKFDDAMVNAVKGPCDALNKA